MIGAYEDSLGSFWTDLLGKRRPAAISPDERQRRAAMVVDYQNLTKLVPGYDAQLDAIEAKHGLSATTEGRRALAQMQMALSRSEDLVRTAYRAAVDDGAIKDGEGLGAFPLILVIAVILAITLYFTTEGIVQLYQANQDAKLANAKLQAWLVMAREKFAATGQLPELPAAGPSPTADALKSGFNSLSLALIAGLALLFLGKRGRR